MRFLPGAVFLFLITLISGCASSYQSLASCGKTTTPYKRLDKNGSVPYGTIESIKQVNYGQEGWHAVITHVDCQHVIEPWEVIHLSEGQHTIRVRFPGGKNVMTTAKNLDNSAQNLSINIRVGKKYSLYAKALAFWDMAFWITENGEVVVHTPNFKPEYLR